MKKILITGSNGLLGQKLVAALKDRTDVGLIATSKGPNRLRNSPRIHFESLDVSDADGLQRVLARHRPDTVIHTAAMTHVDLCETDRTTCWRLNVESVGLLALFCLRYDIHLVHLSTDFIFNGRKGSPYIETDAPDPLSIYGKSKLVSEEILREGKTRFAVLRTILLYGVAEDMRRSNIVLWVKENLEKGIPINVVCDQFRAPTLAEDLAEACVQAALREVAGVYHVAGPQVMSILDLANSAADFFGLDKNLIRPVDSQTLRQPALRPARTGFVLEKAEKVLGYRPHSFKEGLAVVKKQLEDRRIPAV